jgi:hypothetical protein
MFRLSAIFEKAGIPVIPDNVTDFMAGGPHGNLNQSEDSNFILFLNFHNCEKLRIFNNTPCGVGPTSALAPARINLSDCWGKAPNQKRT